MSQNINLSGKNVWGEKKREANKRNDEIYHSGGGGEYIPIGMGSLDVQIQCWLLAEPYIFAVSSSQFSSDARAKSTSNSGRNCL